MSQVKDAAQAVSRLLWLVAKAGSVAKPKNRTMSAELRSAQNRLLGLSRHSAHSGNRKDSINCELHRISRQWQEYNHSGQWRRRKHPFTPCLKASKAHGGSSDRSTVHCLVFHPGHSKGQLHLLQKHPLQKLSLASSYIASKEN